MVRHTLCEQSSSFLGLVLLHSVRYLLKHLSKLGFGETIEELKVRNRASTLELMPDAVDNVAFGTLNH